MVYLAAKTNTVVDVPAPCVAYSAGTRLIALLMPGPDIT